MELVSVYKAAGQLEAEMIKAFLEAQEIPVALNQESVGRTFGLSAGRLGQVQVLVPNSRVDEANKVLKDLREGEYDLGESLPDEISIEDPENLEP
jgi:hypothetical protein